MKLLIIALCLAAGFNSFIRCAIEDASRHSDSASAAAVESMTGSEVDGESWETVETEDSSDGGTAEARLLKVKKHANGRILRFGKGGRFVAGINDVLGKGFAGKVYKATDTKTGHQVAVKTELRSARKGTLQIESINYKIIGRKRGFLRIYYSGRSRDGKSHVLVMQMLTKSLSKLLKKRKSKRFSPKTVYMIGIQMMYRIETLHKARLVHRDIKPGNFGIDETGRHIYIFDFGNSKKYGAQGKHYSEGQRTSVGSGDPRYRSWYAHSHIKQSRRDDMEAIGFMLMSFLRGDLPWDAVRDYKKPASQSQAIKLKEKPDFNELCKGYARQMVDYFQHVRNDLRFKTRPNYPYLRKLFRTALSEMGETDDHKFDWPTKQRH